MLEYKIIDFDSNTHTATIIFDVTGKYQTQSIPIPHANNLYLSGQDLDNYIKSFVPIKPKSEKIGKIENLDYILSLVDKAYYDRNSKYYAKTQAHSIRQHLLDSSDWTQLPDVQKNLDDEDKQLWIEYRQALRDITKQPGWPLNIDWPKRPHILGVTIF